MIEMAATIYREIPNQIWLNILKISIRAAGKNVIVPASWSCSQRTRNRVKSSVRRPFCTFIGLSLRSLSSLDILYLRARSAARPATIATHRWMPQARNERHMPISRTRLSGMLTSCPTRDKNEMINAVVNVDYNVDRELAVPIHHRLKTYNYNEDVKLRGYPIE